MKRNYFLQDQQLSGNQKSIKSKDIFEKYALEFVWSYTLESNDAQYDSSKLKTTLSAW